MNIFSTLDRAATRFAGRGALYRGAVQVATFGELHRRALCLAGWLRGRFPTGSRIVLASENDVRTVEAFYATWAAGMVLVPLNPKLHPREIAQILDDCGAAHLFVSAKIAAGGLEPSCPATILGSPDYEDCLRAEPAEPAEVAPDDLAWLFYTSGTTGRSKGAMLSHRNLLAMTLAHLADVNPADETMSLIHAAPMSHGSGLYILPYVAKGARQVVPDSAGFEAGEYLDLTAVHANAVSFLAPTMIHRLRLEMERAPRRHGIHTIIYGGAPMYLEDLKKAMATFGPVFAQIYGQGEAPMTIATLRRADHAGSDARLGSVGTPYTGVAVRVVDGDGRALPPGVAGEVVVRGDVVMAGYWNNPAATAEALRGGWLWTGDVGSFDDAGFLTLSDRSKDVVISGGSNIYPREVEETLLAHPAVSEVCVIGRPDPEWGEVVVAFVVAAPGTEEAALRDQLDALCLSRIARFKRPKDYVFLPDLPKSSYGKILKRELRAWDQRGNKEGS